ncbi:hypothetical protein QE152_g18993 [Popillia japonica]|uniref:Uncharacterized protein n=1 Tax=Popillia japonica TaxID=7064 RepID=A0AAW1L4V6_POPJA
MTKHQQLPIFSANFYDDIAGSECADKRNEDLSHAAGDHSDHDTSSKLEVESEDDLGDVSQESFQGDINIRTYTLCTTLEIVQPFKSHSIELIDSEYSICQEDLEDYLQEKSRPCRSEEGGILDMEYKENAVNYRNRIGKRSECCKLSENWEKKRLSLETVQNRFRMKREKLTPISQYVL